MPEVERGQTNQKGCFVCGKALMKIGNTLILKGSNGKIAFCSYECSLKYNPDNDLTQKKTDKKKKKIDSLLVSPVKLKEPKTPITQKPEDVKDVKPKLDKEAEPLKPQKSKPASSSSKPKEAKSKIDKKSKETEKKTPKVAPKKEVAKPKKSVKKSETPESSKTAEKKPQAKKKTK